MQQPFFNMPKSASTGGLTHHQQQHGMSGFGPSQQQPYRYHPPAYRGPPPPGPAQVQQTRPANPSPATSGEFPPPYRNPPPPPSSMAASSSYNRFAVPNTNYGMMQPSYPVRPPHYSPPPTQRSTHLSRHPSRSSLMGGSGGGSGGGSASAVARMNQHGLPSRQHAEMQSSRVRHVKQVSFIVLDQN